MKGYEKTINLYPRFKDKGHPHIGKYDVASGYFHPVFQSVRPEAWEYTEKIDGMNIRIIITRPDDGDISWEVRGKTDRAQLPGDLVDNIDKMMINRGTELRSLELEEPGSFLTLYGEGYGAGIQKGAGYRADKGFILFDIGRGHVNEDGSIFQYYLDHEDKMAVSTLLKLDQVPALFSGLGLPAVTKAVREGLYNSTGRPIEGIVGIAPGLYYFNDGGLRRLKFKLKHKDFPGGTT